MLQPQLRLTLALLVAGGLVAGGVRAEDWPHWRGPLRNGVSPEKGWNTKWPAAGPVRLWSTNIGRSYAAVAVWKSRVYALGAQDGQETLRCLDAASGALLWKFAQPHPKRAEQYDPYPTASTGSPVVEAGRVYLLTREGLALCLDAEKGALLWSRDLAKETGGTLPPFGSGSSPLVQGARVIYNLGKHGIALDILTGAVLWNSGAGVGGHATPVYCRLGSDEALLFFANDGLMGVELATGRLLWRHPWTSRGNLFTLDPLVLGDEALISGYNHAQLLRLTLQGATVIYDVRRLRSTFSNPLLLNGRLYGNDRGGLQCVDWKSGAEKWLQPDLLTRPRQAGEPEATRPPVSEGALIAAGSYLIVLDDHGVLRLVSTAGDTYRETVSAKVLNGPCWTLPVLASGLLYCHNNEGDLVCLDLRLRK
jgi:outer membrane protein assembly factor BamB